TCIAIIQRDPRVQSQLERHRPSALRMSSITHAELRFGASKSSRRERATHNLLALCARVSVVAFDEAAAVAYGEVRHVLERRGVPIGPLDTLIAAQAVSLRWTLVTHNLREFRRVP